MIKRIVPGLLGLLFLVGCGTTETARTELPSQPTTIQKEVSKVSQDSLQESETKTPEEPLITANEQTPAPITPKVLSAPGQTTGIEPGQPKQAPSEPEKVQQPQVKQVDLTGWVEYHTDDLKTLSKYLSEGYVIIHDGKYYASPKLVEMIENAETVYEKDISEGRDIPERGLTPDAEYVIIE